MSEVINKSITAEIMGEKLLLLPEKAVYWKKRETLFLADLHLGKVDHFRKEGIGIPAAAAKNNIIRLKKLILDVAPKRVVFLGDLFHSDYNLDWLAFNDLLEELGAIDFLLVEGNHDILGEKRYQESKLCKIEGILEDGPFILSHEPLEEVKEGKYNLCGHLHPAVRMHGKAKQSMKLACFYFGDNTGILPAFGTFTGTAVIKPMKGEKVYVVAGEKVIRV